MKITYIEHSGFLLEMAEAYFLFDYYEGIIPELKKEKPLIVFVSHKHQDHYNPVIFELLKEYPDTKYVLSNDVPIKRETVQYKEQGIELERAVTVMKKGESRVLEMANGTSLRIETLKSTDEGVAFLVECKGETIYHAGDLNLWVWEEESKQYNENMKHNYFTELTKLKDRKIDVAFVPLDPRQEKDAFAGLESFLAYTESRVVFPMHFWGNYKIIEEFHNRRPEYREKVQKIEYAGHSFEI